MTKLEWIAVVVVWTLPFWLYLIKRVRDRAQLRVPMTPHELISSLRDCGEQSLSVTLCYLADRVDLARLAGGSRLCDASDFRVWLLELAEAARIRDNFVDSTKVPNLPGNGTCPKVTAAVTQRAPQSRNWNACPDCGHVHVEDAECGFPTGGGRVCRCERAVPA
jgi:hypothetical protein